MRVTVLASGSGGNACLFDDGATCVLVDAGIPPATVQQRLARAGARAPDAVVITHAHHDHYAHVDAVSQHFGAPVWVSESTRRRLSLHGAMRVRVFGARTAFEVGTVTVTPTPVPHDAAQVALRLTGRDGRSAALATDLGEVPPALEGLFRGCDTVLLESNHDVGMLWRGPYSMQLKRRVASAHGHLSNDQCAALLRRLDRSVEAVVLMHLSETNNLPEIARACAAEALADHTARLLVAMQDAPLAVHGHGVAPTPPKQLSLF